MRRSHTAAAVRTLVCLALAATAAVAATPAATTAHAATASTEGQCVQLPNDGSQCPTWGHTWLNPGGANAACATENVPQNQVADATGVYVTGWACDSHDELKPDGTWLPGNDVFTVAYNLDGSVRWTARYNGPGGADDAIGDEGWGIAVSPSGDRVYVTGGQNGGLGGNPLGSRFVSDFITLAYDTTTGAQLWDASYHGPAVGSDIAEQVAVSADGQRVYVTGESQAPDLPGGGSGGSDVATIAYVAATGVQDWVSRYHAPASTRNNAVGATSIAVLGDVVDTAGAYQASSGSGYEVIAIRDDRANHAGVPLWTTLSDPSLFLHPARGAFASTPNGVFLAGSASSTVAPPSTCPPQQTSGASNAAFMTVALDPQTGVQRWSERFTGLSGGDNGAFGLATDSAGSRVYVAGQASDAAPQCAISIGTVAYDGSTGTAVWRDVQAPLAGTDPQGFAVTASPDGSRVYVAGLEYYLDTLGFRGDSRVLAYDPAGTLLWSGRYGSAPVGPVTDLDSFAYFLSLSPDGSTVYLSNQVNRHDEVNGNSQLYGTVAYSTLLPSPTLPEAPLVPGLVLVAGAGVLLATARRRRRASGYRRGLAQAGRSSNAAQ
ncbi:MAG: PQQ-binding-like beta-propeller repeat protein [Candidatus Dormibacteria bacterium]